jgi:hypothetical protein
MSTNDVLHSAEADEHLDRVRPLVSWLERPLSGRQCALGWLAAAVIFIGLVRLLGGPSQGDLSESVYSTWAVAHGQLACSYPPTNTHGIPPIAYPATFVAPLWPLLSGAVEALTRIGHTAPFPSQAALGPHCSTALKAMYKWSVSSEAVASTLRLAYLSWLVLMAGVVALLRAVGRGRRGWEPATLILMACIPTVWTPLVQYFHPQDLVAMGLLLGGLACIQRGWWISAGVLFGLAVTSQQFALLVLVPLVMVAPKDRRVRFLAAAIGTAAIVLAPLVALTSGRALRAVLVGSGNTVSFGGTVVWEMHLHGSLLVAVSRMLPIFLALALGWWVARQIGLAALNPVPLMSLIATSLSFRLVFEENIFGYYFMALAVALVALDVINGHIRGQVVAWLGLVTLAFSPVSWGFMSNSVAWGLQEREFLPFVLMAIALLLVVRDVRRGQIRWYLVGWLVLVTLAFARIPWENPPFRHALPSWFWQIVLVSTGIVLAVGPLLSCVRDRPDLHRHASAEPLLALL